MQGTPYMAMAKVTLQTRYVGSGHSFAQLIFSLLFALLLPNPLAYMQGENEVKLRAI